MLLCPILTHSHGVVGGGRQEQLALAAQLAETAGVREIEAGAATGLHRLLEGLRMRMLLALGAQERLVHLRIGIVLLRGAPRTAHPELELEGRHGRRLGGPPAPPLPLAYGYLSTAIAFLFERALDVAADLTTSKITEEGIEITENTEIERVREIKRGRA